MFSFGKHKNVPCTLFNILCDFHRKHVIMKVSLWEIKMEMLAKFSNLKICFSSVTVPNRSFLIILILVCELTLETL